MSGLPDPVVAIFERQHGVAGRSQLLRLLRALRLGSEYRGDVDHGDAVGRTADDQRFAAASAAGMELVAVTAADLRDPGFEAWIRGLIAARTFELARTLR